MAATTLHALWDTTRMRLLVAIEREGSVSAAASAIGIGQPSASQHMRLLEAAAGQRLIERSGRGSRLTGAGLILAATACLAADDSRRALVPFVWNDVTGSRDMPWLGGGGRARWFVRDIDRKSTRLNSSHIQKSRMPSSA